MRLAPLLAAAALCLSACDTYHYVAGKWREDTRKPVQALAHYEAFLADKPLDSRACEIRLRAAALYRTFGRCPEARAHLEAAARDFPGLTECTSKAKLGLLTCPDYFPLDRGRTWTYVDSESKGKAARLDWEVRQATASFAGAIQTSLYAGNRRIREGAETYRKQDWAVWRTDVNPAEPFLRYPFNPGQTWTAKRGKAGVTWKVVAAGIPVKTAAGAFTDCLKVEEHDLRYAKTWRYDYYCPDVGRVKITVGGPGFENPNMELLRFDKMK
ncbi:MAG: hypothetical protein KGJ84_10125 [Elusimicrobia bacterium]|nr:hypothetical protein [Elusimicrobiota bacterium]